jgi:hypothetical protein
MNKVQSFKRTLIPSKSKIQTDIWDNVVDLFEEKKYKESLLRLFDYVDKDIKTKRANADQTEFNVPHGSVIVNIKIEGDQLNVKVPFLKLAEKNNIPILRRIAEINFSPLNLATIVLEGNELFFKYSTPMQQCEPWKMYYVFREICINADNYDDEFIQKFGAIRFQEPNVTEFSNEKKEEIWSTYQFLLSETKEYCDYFESKRQEGYLWDALLQLFLNIDYYIAPQGALRTEIEDVVSFMQNRNYSLQEKNEKGKNLYKKFQNIAHDDFNSNLYISDLFIPIKYSASLENVRETFTNQYETAKKEMSNSDYMGATLSIRYIFLYEFYYSFAPDDVVETMTAALEQSSSKSWDEAAKILWAAMEKIMTGQASQAQNKETSFARNEATFTNNTSSNKDEVKEENSNEKPKKGFFGKIFGK